MAALVLPGLSSSILPFRLLPTAFVTRTLALPLAPHPLVQLRRELINLPFRPLHTLLDRLLAPVLGPYSLADLNPFGILWAVPKKKVSHSRKRMRSAHKGIKPDLGLSSCPACGEPKRQHFLCLNCYADKVLENSKSFKTPWEKGITP